jgi:hypothetical protein
VRCVLASALSGSTTGDTRSRVRVPSSLFLRLASSLAAVLAAAGIPAAQSLTDTTAAPPLTVVRRYAVPEAKQGVAVDARFFYPIDDAAIGKYEKETGMRVGRWTGEAGGRITHLDSGVVMGERLYCAHSNYPRTPMVSSVEIFDIERMTHVESLPLPHLGSATWLDRAHGSWWVTFAHYGAVGGEPGKTPADTTLVEFNDRWQPQHTWSFPRSVVERWGAMSSSGGAWHDGLLYTTGHDARELYALQLPASGSVLALRQIVPFESHGQGIAIDRGGRSVYSIQRQSREVIVSRLPR